MPLMTRRSSARSTPRTSVGKCGSIRSHCSSLSQNKFLRTARIPKKTNHATWNQDCLGLAAELMSSDPRTGNQLREQGIAALSTGEVQVGAVRFPVCGTLKMDVHHAVFR